MILGFKQKFPWGEPTNFREKILSGAGYDVGFYIIPGEKGMVDATKIPVIAKSKTGISVFGFKPKIHTFREDKYDRWKPEMNIQMVYRGPKYSIIDHFNKDIPELEKCKSIQKIKLWVTGCLGEIENGQRQQITKVQAIVDGKRIENTEDLVKNDGFESVIEFSRWFSKPWEGKIIHWTDFRY